MKYWKVLLMLAIAAVVIARAYVFFSASGTIPASELSYASEFHNSTQHADVWKVSYDSHGARIYALLSIPKSVSAVPGKKAPAFVMLPANSINKEAEQEWAGNLLNGMGFVTLSVDQRGEGETQGEVRPIEQDFEYYVNGRKTVQHLMVEDALNAFRLLRSVPEVDETRIYMLGESMGGRFAVIAAASEPEIAGVVLISSAGYGFNGTGNEKADEFLYSIDPDNFVSAISPRKTVMIHAESDSVIPIERARHTFSRALEPKKFHALNSSFHGYLKAGTGIEEILEAELRDW